MNNLSWIEINFDQFIKELFWFEDALANGYQKTIVLLKDYYSLLTTVLEILMARWKLQLTDTHIPLTRKHWEGNISEKRRAKDIPNML